VINEIRSQFDLAWALADLHLSALVEDDMSPASGRCPQVEDGDRHPDRRDTTRSHRRRLVGQRPRCRTAAA
jgi:hypothetical protein